VKKNLIVILLFLSAACSRPTPPAAAGLPATPLSLELPVKWTDTSTSTTTPTSTPTPTVTQTPTDTPTPTHSPPPTKTAKPFSNGMTARPASDGDVNTIPSVWTLVHYRELLEPGSAEYAATVAIGSSYVWDWSFCAVKGNFTSFLEAISLRFLLDGEWLREGEHLRVTEGSGASGWLCRRWRTVLSGWPPNRSVRLDIRWTIQGEADDGVTDYPAGAYTQLILVIAE